MQRPQQKYQVGDRVYSRVHHQIKTVLAVEWKPADKQWVACYKYQLSDTPPGYWLYEATLAPAQKVAS